MLESGGEQGTQGEDRDLGKVRVGWGCQILGESWVLKKKLLGIFTER